MLSKSAIRVRRWMAGLCVAAVVTAAVGDPVRGSVPSTSASDAAPMESPSDGAATQLNAFQMLQSLHLHLAKSFDSFESQGADPKNYDPATFSLSHTPRNTSYTAQYFLGWAPGGGTIFNGWVDLSPILSAEGNIDSTQGENTVGNAIDFRATAHGIHAADLKTGFTFDASAEYEASRSFLSQDIVADFQLRPVIDDLAIQRRKNLFANDTSVQILWQPWIGLDAGNTLRQPRAGTPTANPPTATHKTILRLDGTLEGKLFMNGISRALHMDEVSVSMQETFYFVPSERKDTDNYWTTSLNFLPSNDVSVSVSYTIGRQPPEFKKTELLQVSVGVRF